MPQRLAHPEVLVTSLDDFLEKMKKSENHPSFFNEVITAQRERKRLRDKDTRRRLERKAAKDAATAPAAAAAV